MRLPLKNFSVRAVKGFRTLDIAYVNIRELLLAVAA